MDIKSLEKTDPIAYKLAIKDFNADLNQQDYDKPSTKETPLTLDEVKTKLDLFKEQEPKGSKEVKHFEARWKQIMKQEPNSAVQLDLIDKFNTNINTAFPFDKPSAAGLGDLTVSGVRGYVNSLPDGTQKENLLSQVKKAGQFNKPSQKKALGAIFANVNELLKVKPPTVSGVKAKVDKQTEVKNVQKSLAVGAYNAGEKGVAETHYLRHVEARISEAAAKGGEDYNGHVVYDAAGIEPSRVYGTVLDDDFGKSEEGKEIQESIEEVRSRYANQEILKIPMSVTEYNRQINEITASPEYKIKLFEFLQKAQRTTAGRDKYQRILHITVRPPEDWYANESAEAKMMRLFLETVTNPNDEPE
jgi:hypothetical protein